MDIEHLREYCISKKGVTEEFPFDNDTLVFKVMGKMFALSSLKRWEEGEPSINLKCDPDRALELREQYNSIKPGFHMSKKHWNTVYINADAPYKLVIELIDHSYQMVVKALPKKVQEQLNKI
ncbi:MmcQ/YjbR family DNA-binding protein [Abyssalbus ytuae]|uniref:MmcQ/YjbR family DNA-binding protein n=1 Tax=Abyssalbus ytuae TaxID=2926907 RepID=A0A9E6ZWJ6_9FLAO|nr:MmcQ/YjbR family DNA-binding protein [Abyssalbus ytuae]UOB19078.1 MmcQ/YjbR family DNA-binding protein [Abyssalbus ytuae]